MYLDNPSDTLMVSTKIKVSEDHCKRVLHLTRCASPCTQQWPRVPVIAPDKVASQGCLPTPRLAFDGPGSLSSKWNVLVV
jgi:hypothetical protein